MSSLVKRLLNAPFWPVLVLGAGILLFNHSQFLPAGLLSDGDLSANQLMIRDADKLQLGFGSYSRFGFHHPGPISFYYLAFAEHLFRPLPSTLGSQRLAQLVLNLALLHVVLRMIQQLTGERRDRWLYLALIAAAVLPICFEQHPFYDYWGPYLTIVPQVMFLLAAGLVLAGEFQWFPALCVGAVISGHNHYLNAALTLTVALVVAAGVLVFRRAELRAYFGRKRHWLWLLFVALSLAPPLVEEWTGNPGNLTRTAEVLASSTPAARTVRDVLTGVFWNAGSTITLGIPGLAGKWGLVPLELVGVQVVAWIAAVAASGLWSRRGFAPVTAIMGLAYVVCLVLGAVMLDNPVQVPYVFHFTAGISAYFNFLLIRALARRIRIGGRGGRLIRAVLPALAASGLVVFYCARHPVHSTFSTNPHEPVLSSLADTKTDAVNVYLEFGREDHDRWQRFVLFALQCEEAGYRVRANPAWAFMIGGHRTGEILEGAPLVIFSGADLSPLSAEARLRRVTDETWIMPAAPSFAAVDTLIRAARAPGDL